MAAAFSRHLQHPDLLLPLELPGHGVLEDYSSLPDRRRKLLQRGPVEGHQHIGMIHHLLRYVHTNFSCL